jgi:arylsulfatase
MKARKGSIVEKKAHVMDILPTVLEITGINYPTEISGRNITQIDGKSIYPIIKGTESEDHEYLFFEHVTGRAVIKGNWKLVSKIKKQDLFNEFSKWELYDLSKDRTETNDLISQYPEIAEDLKIRWNEWFKDYEDLR